MRIGFALPNGGTLATPEVVSRVARHAESLGYDTLWTFERLLYAVKRRTLSWHPGWQVA